MNEYQIKREKKAKEFVNMFSDLVNDGGFDVEPILTEFVKQHRTLQQKMFGVFLAVIELVSNDDYHTDARNENTKKKAKMLIKGYADQLAKDYLENSENPHDEYYKKRAEEIKEGFLNNPGNYLQMPLI